MIVREHSVVGMQSGVKIADSVIIQSICIAPGKTIDIGAHSRYDGMACFFTVSLHFIQRIIEYRDAYQFCHIQIVSAQTNFSASYISLKFLFQLLICHLVEIFDLPVVLTLPYKAIAASRFSTVDIIQNLNRLTDKIIMITHDFLLALCIADIRM